MPPQPAPSARALCQNCIRTGACSLCPSPSSSSPKHFHRGRGVSFRWSHIARETTNNLLWDRSRMKEWEYESAAETENTTGKSRGPRGKGGERERKKKSDTEKEEKKREEGESGRMHPGHDSRWCLKCFGGLFPLLSLLMSFLCSCVF